MVNKSKFHLDVPSGQSDPAASSGSIPAQLKLTQTPSVMQIGKQKVQEAAMEDDGNDAEDGDAAEAAAAEYQNQDSSSHQRAEDQIRKSSDKDSVWLLSWPVAVTALGLAARPVCDN